MDKIKLLACALDYIEENLTDDCKAEEIAKNCYCSKSSLEKLFRCINGISVHDYVVRRRMMKAAKMIYEDESGNLLDIALTVGYNSNEAFTRAFKQIWHCNPSEFRGKMRYSELFPRFLPPLETGDDYMKERKKVDISELYDLFKERKNCYFVCCDIKNLIPINDISLEAGDIAILTSMERMNEAAGENDVVFRIGGDEFTLLTDSEDKAYAESVAEKICACNGKPFLYQDREIPLTLHVSVTRLQGQTIRYDELFEGLHKTIRNMK